MVIEIVFPLVERVENSSRSDLHAQEEEDARICLGKPNPLLSSEATFVPSLADCTVKGSVLGGSAVEIPGILKGYPVDLGLAEIQRIITIGWVPPL